MIRLQGVAIGNGQMRPALQYASTVDYALGLGLIDAAQAARFAARYARCAAQVAAGDTVGALATCQRAEDALLKGAAGDVFAYDVRKSPGDPLDALWGAMERYFAQPAAAEHFHATLERGGATMKIIGIADQVMKQSVKQTSAGRSGVVPMW